MPPRAAGAPVRAADLETRGAWELVLTADGTPTLRHPVHGEACHSVAGAFTQARERYVRGARVRERLCAAGEAAVLEVGTGLGLNAAALVEAAAECGGRLALTTLERDPLVLWRGFEIGASAGAWNPGTEPSEAAQSWLRPAHAALRAALAGCGAGPADAGEVRDSGVVALGEVGTLRLLLGDARAALGRLGAEERFDALFLDPFSPRVEPELWEPDFLAALARRLAPDGWLATYSAATAVRAALAAAGLRVGSGGRVGTKADGTLASPEGEPPRLPPRAHRRIERRARELAQALLERGRGGRSGEAERSSKG